MALSCPWSEHLMKRNLLSLPLCSFDNAEVYADGKAETVMGQAIKVSLLKIFLRLK